MNLPSEQERAFFNANGYLTSPDTLEPEAGDIILRLFASSPAGPGTRLGLEDPDMRYLADSRLAVVASSLLAADATPVRAILFTKSKEANWLVPWHQDVTLAMPRKLDLPGGTNWTQKEGHWHVQPHISILNRMVALRVHVDPCGLEDGPLRVIPGSHLKGRIDESEVESVVQRSTSETLTAEPGQIIAMHPLTLHSSPKATGSSRRRVLHIEYCEEALYRWQ